jgi:roadblock/LC7 domain-containing protein
MAEDVLGIHGVEPRGGEMVRPGSLKTVEDCAAWIYEHDGRISAWWEAQRDHNARATATVNACQKTMQDKIGAMGDKIDKLQKTVWLATGGTMMAGGIIGIAVTVGVAFFNGH